MTTVAEPARHFLGLPDAALIETDSLLLVGQTINDCVEERAMGVVHGVAGVGKTFSLEHHLAGREDVEQVWIEALQRPTMLDIAQGMMLALTGAKPPGRRRDVLDELVALLCERPRLVIVDEAQRLNHECIDFLRYLHDRRQTDFALLLAGGNNCWQVLRREPMLRSRIWRRVQIRPLRTAAILEHMPAYHPIYRDADGELLLWIDERFAHGVLRDWAALTHTAARLCVKQDRGLDQALARTALALHGGALDD